MRGDIDSVNFRSAAGWCDQSRQHFNCGRLAGAVWPDKSKDITWTKRQRSPFDGDE
jgi:hypothetical protein